MGRGIGYMVIDTLFDIEVGAVLDKADYLGWRNEAKALSFNGKKAGTPA